MSDQFKAFKKKSDAKIRYIIAIILLSALSATVSGYSIGPSSWVFVSSILVAIFSIFSLVIYLEAERAHMMIISLRETQAVLRQKKKARQETTKPMAPKKTRPK